jgi:ethanolamine transporter EutH
MLAYFTQKESVLTWLHTDFHSQNKVKKSVAMCYPLVSTPLVAHLIACGTWRITKDMIYVYKIWLGVMPFVINIYYY